MRPHVPESGWREVVANGLRFACIEEGEGPLVLLVHGFPDTAHTWDDLRPALAKAGYRAVSPFLRGYAPSEIPADGDYRAETLGRDILALIEALGEERAIVIGHDFGAFAAYAAASLAPERISRLVAVAIPHPASLKPSVGGLMKARHFITLQLPGAVGRFQKRDFDEIRRLWKRWSPNYTPPDPELEPIKNAFAAPGCTQAALAYYKANVSAKPPAFLRTRIEVPTLLVGGRTDGVATPEDFEAGQRRHTGPWELAMTDGGHFLHREDPEAFEAIVMGWLGKA